MAGQNRALTVTLDREDVREVERVLSGIRNGADTAILRSVNKALTGAKTDMARETAKILNLTQKRIKKDIKVKKASKTNLSGRVESTGKPVNLMQFKARQKKKGVSVKVLKQGGRKTIPGAFIFVGRNQNQLVGWRKKTSTNAQYIGSEKKKPWMSYGALPRQYRFPIEGLYGPRIQDITARDEVINKIEVGAQQRMKKELAHQVQRILDKHRML